MQVQIYYQHGSCSFVPTFSAGLFLLQIYREAPWYLQLQAIPRVLHTSTGIIKGTPPSPRVKKSALGWIFSGLACEGGLSDLQVDVWRADAKTRRREDAKMCPLTSPLITASLSHLARQILLPDQDKGMSSASLPPVSL